MLKRISAAVLSGKYVSPIDPLNGEVTDTNCIGLIWFDTSTNTTVVKVAVSLAGVISWKEI